MDAPHWLRVAILFGAFIAIGVWEFARPRRAPQGALGERWASNLSLYFANTVIAALLCPAPDGVAAQLESSLSISLLHWPSSAPLLGFVVGFVLLDFLRYATHWLSHRVHFLWRLH